MNMAPVTELSGKTALLKNSASILAFAMIGVALSAFYPGFTAKHAATNAELASSRSTDYPALVRDSIATAGDAPPLEFVASNLPCSLNGGAGDIGTQVPSADGKCWIANNGNELDPREFGAKCDGSTDDTAALQAWANRASTGARLRIPSASGCAFSSTISFPASRNVALSGDGRSSRLVYIGASTTNDLLVIGASGTMSGCTGAAGWTIKDFRLISNTVMTAGDGVHAHDICDSTISNVMIGGEWGGGNQNLWNALHLDGFNTVHISGIISGQGDGILLNGVTEGVHYYGNDIFIADTKIDHMGVAVHVAGGVGGVEIIPGIDILENGRHLLVDQTIDANPNGQIFVKGGTLDVSGASYVPTTSGYYGAADNGIDIDVLDPGQSSNQSILEIDGTWLASAGKQCLDLKSGTGWDVRISGGAIYNCQSDGVRNEGAGNIIHIAAARIGQNGGYGVNNTVSDNSVFVQGVTFQPNNASGNTNGSVFGAWFDSSGNYFATANPQVQIRSNATGSLMLCTGSTSSQTGIGLQNGSILPWKCDGTGASTNAFAVGNSSFPLSSLYANLARLTPSSFASIGSCAAGNNGVVAFVNDANVVTGTITAGGGSHKVLAVCSNSSWIALGGA